MSIPAIMHVPKTGGTSMTRALIEGLQPRRVTGGFDRSMFGGFSEFDTLSEAARAYVYLTLEELPETDFIGGHFAFSTLTARYPGARLLTVIREPMSRLLSHWLFWRSALPKTNNGWGKWASYAHVAHGTLSEFITNPDVACQTDNVFTRMLVWPHERLPTGFIPPSADDELRALCKQRLTQFAAALVLEDPNLWLKAAMSMNSAELTPRFEKVTEPTPPAYQGHLDEHLTENALIIMRERSRLDMQLWKTLVAEHMPDVRPSDLAQRTFARMTSIGARLIAGSRRGPG